MSAQVAPTRPVGGTISLLGYFAKDANGNPVVNATVNLNVLSGPAGGLVFFYNSGNPYIQATKPGTYTFTVTVANDGGSLVTDGAGDTGGVADSITIVDPAPASQGWTYPTS